MPVPRRIRGQGHDRTYHEAISHVQLSDAERRRIGRPATLPLVRRRWLAVGGTLLTTRLALSHGLASHLAGGTHHAFASFGSGFSIFNDVAVAARQLLAVGSGVSALIDISELTRLRRKSYGVCCLKKTNLTTEGIYKCLVACKSQSTLTD